METYATPFIKLSIGIAILIVALGFFVLAVTPLANVLVGLVK